MRLSISLDKDLYELAETRARLHRTSISREVNTLLRQAIKQPQPSDVSITPKPHGRRGFPVCSGFNKLTTEDVQRIEEEEDIRQSIT